MSDDRIAVLQAEIEKLRERLKALEPKAGVEIKPFKPPPWQAVDWAAAASMDRATMAEFAAAASGGRHCQ